MSRPCPCFPSERPFPTPLAPTKYLARWQRLDSHDPRFLRFPRGREPASPQPSYTHTAAERGWAPPVPLGNHVSTNPRGVGNREEAKGP